MQLTYPVYGKQQTLNFQPMSSVIGISPAAARSASTGAGAKAASRFASSVAAVKKEMSHLHDAWNDIHESDTRYALVNHGTTLIIATDSMTLEGATKAEMKHLRDKFGFELIREGQQGKVMLRAPATNKDAMQLVQSAIDEMQKRGKVTAVNPNFIRSTQKPRPVSASQPLWNHDNSGSPGVPGADVAALAAWTLTKGHKDIRVAVLDEGVDSNHPALKQVIVAEKDFVDGNSHARPDADDAHGTACAGIICSQDSNYPGLAPECSIVAVRIAKGDGDGHWIFDDFNTADAIDWSWKEGKADVLSNSWGGGPEVDTITNAIQRARTKGRARKGSVVVFAAGNSNRTVHYPGSLPDVLTVGASNQWDERKTPTSKDDETTWGSCFGDSLDLLAPGVKIATTDISGSQGYSGSNFTLTFNGTSSATPHVAAAAALILSLMPKLNETRVREIITSTCDALHPSGQWHKNFGYGRLNIYAALRRARR